MDPVGANKSLVTIERSVSLADAEVLGQQAVSDLGLFPVFEEWDDTGGGPTAWSCDLVDSAGIKVDHGFGYGKGNRAEARVGALFEALEHTLTSFAYFDPVEAFLRPAGEIATGPLRTEASAVILADAPEHELACLRYASPVSADEVDVPVYLSVPWYVQASADDVRNAIGDNFNYENITRYSSNSGCAIGVNSNEAIVHAINEVIERDAFSLLLIHVLLAEDEFPAVVDSHSLPDFLRGLLSYVEERIGSRVYLIDMTTDVDVPAYMAYVLPVEGSQYLDGHGASLNSHYAVYRALTELLQGYLFRSHVRPKIDSLTRLELLRQYPSLYRCGAVDLAEPLSRAHAVTFKDYVIPASEPKAHLAELSSRISVRGFEVYHRVVRSLSNGVTAVHVIVPGMERFMGVTQGVPAPPGERGLRAVGK